MRSDSYQIFTKFILYLGFVRWILNLPDKQHAQIIFSRLKKLYPESGCSLKFINPRELLVSTILSAQCTDKQVNKVTRRLFKKYTSARAFAEAPLDEIKEYIRSTGFYNNKAKSIKESMKTIIEKFNGKVPDKMEDLLQLEGVGRKTANVVLGDTFGVPGIVVDTHVGRLSRRLGLTENSNPEKIEQDLMSVFPKENWTLLGHLFMDHGRAVCNARNPKCGKCVLSDICPSALFGD